MRTPLKHMLGSSAAVLASRMGSLFTAEQAASPFYAPPQRKKRDRRAKQNHTPQSQAWGDYLAKRKMSAASTSTLKKLRRAHRLGMKAAL